MGNDRNNPESPPGKEQEWWLPSFPRWAYSSWTEAFTSGARNDLIGILADKVVAAIDKNVDTEGPAVQKLLDDHLPSDQESVRSKLLFYDATLQAIQYQRDQYLLGTAYADKKQAHRERTTAQRSLGLHNDKSNSSSGPRMPHDASSSMGHSQLVTIGTAFLPSETVKGALMPIVLDLPSGALKHTITTTVSNAIPLAQPPLDNAVKNAVMGVISNPQIRDMIKSRTQKILRVDDDDDTNDHDG